MTLEWLRSIHYHQVRGQVRWSTFGWSFVIGLRWEDTYLFPRMTFGLRGHPQLHKQTLCVLFDNLLHSLR